VSQFRFNWYGFHYESGLRVIQQTYQAANQSLKDQKFQCYAQLEAIRRGEITDEYDPDDGESSKVDILEYQIESVEKSAQALRQAILVMLYHFWEKQVGSWAKRKLKRKEVGGEKSYHHAYVSYCQDNGLDVETELINTLQYVVNLTKHGPNWEKLKSEVSDTTNRNDKSLDPWEDRLLKSRPDLFATDVQSDDPCDFLYLTHEHIEEFFSAVGRSGPNSGSTFQPTRLDMIS
jgi:hypothetical protein